MSKKFTKVIDRTRVVANKYQQTLLPDGVILEDIPSNINTVGTVLGAELFNPMQQGLVFYSDTIHTVANSQDIYELDLEGINGLSFSSGLDIFLGLTLHIRINDVNTQVVTKIKISGTLYDLVKEENSTFISLGIGEIKSNKIYKIIYDGTRFIIPTTDIATETVAGITKYGTEADTALEGKRLAEIIGLEFGGNIQDAGNKVTGKFYYDTVTKRYFECTQNNSLTYNDNTKFKAISNKTISDRLDNLFKVETLSATNFTGYNSATNTTEWYSTLPSWIKARNIIAVTNENGGVWGEHCNIDYLSNCIRIGCLGDASSLQLSLVKVTVAYFA